MARVADIVSVDEGAILIKEGERGRELIVIVEGSAVVRRNNRKIAGLGAGDSLGEMSLLDRQLATATVVTTEPCQLVVIDGRRFESGAREPARPGPEPAGHALHPPPRANKALDL